MTGNLLGRETSPYLLQHKDNPVHWRPWGIEAFAEARVQDKPVLLSVGYAACHWCHVMAHESFEDAETAALMNEGFINIKVDREERPDVDAIYQSALALIGEHGGWPLTMFL
ncbi:MAG: thioredoxin domain-containing protein, partial [Alphaproteobacteria bacterium]